MRSADERAAGASPAGPLDVAAVRAEVPALHQEVHGRPLVYLDNAATTQRPEPVIQAIVDFYRRDNANVHRGAHALAERATAAYEGARARVARFLGAADPREVVFVRGTTEAINLVAHGFVRPRARPGDEVLISALEHHANVVPWQLLGEQTGLRLRVAPISDGGALDLEALSALITARTRLVAVVHASNVLGTVTPVEEVARLARARGVPLLVDGAQAVAHGRVDVERLGCDFYAFSAHKAFGPTGVGALWGRAALLEAMSPWQGGGEMIRAVRHEGSEYAAPPRRFEAGTPHVAGAVGLAAALDWLERWPEPARRAHEEALTARLLEVLAGVPGLRLLGAPAPRIGLASFVLEGVPAHELAVLLDQAGVAIRAGHHCAQPLLERLGAPATARASLALYNTLEEVDALGAALHEARALLSG